MQFGLCSFAFHQNSLQRKSVRPHSQTPIERCTRWLVAIQADEICTERKDRRRRSISKCKRNFWAVRCRETKGLTFSRPLFVSCWVSGRRARHYSWYSCSARDAVVPVSMRAGHHDDGSLLPTRRDVAWTDCVRKERVAFPLEWIAFYPPSVHLPERQCRKRRLAINTIAEHEQIATIESTYTLEKLEYL